MSRGDSGARRLRGVRKWRAVTPAPFPASNTMTRWRATAATNPIATAGHRRCIGGVRRLEFPRVQAHRRQRRVVRAIPARIPHRGRALRFRTRWNALAKSEMAAPGLGYITLEGSNQELAGVARSPTISPPMNSPRSPALRGRRGDVVSSPPGEGRSGKARRRRHAVGQELVYRRGRLPLLLGRRLPMYERSEETGQIEFQPQPVLDAPGARCARQPSPLRIRAPNTYRLQRRGAGSGAIRNHRPTSCTRPSRSRATRRQDVETVLAHAQRLRYGGAPHGGLAPASTYLMLLADTPNIREIIVFPMKPAGARLNDASAGAGTPSGSRNCISASICAAQTAVTKQRKADHIFLRHRAPGLCKQVAARVARSALREVCCSAAERGCAYSVRRYWAPLLGRNFSPLTSSGLGVSV